MACGNTDNIEVELKFHLNTPVQIIDKLNIIAKKDRDKEYQKDTYYDAPHKNFLDADPVREWLRIREKIIMGGEEGENRVVNINYKDWHHTKTEREVFCDEFQTIVQDSKIMREILKRLGFTELVVVEKKRSTWIYKDVEIAIDEVIDLGFYAELEFKGGLSVEKAKEHLYTIAVEIGLRKGDQDFKGYPHILMAKQGLILD